MPRPHVSIPWLKSGLKTKKTAEKVSRPMKHDKYVNENMLCHVKLALMCGHVHQPTDVQSQRPVSLPLCKVNMSNSITIRKSILAGVKGRVRSYSIYIENLKLVGSVQRVSNLDQNVKFNHYKKTGSSGVKGRFRSNSIYIENLKLVGSVQRGSNPGQNVKFNHYWKTDSCRDQRSTPALPTHPLVSAIVKSACLCARVDGRNHSPVRGG